MAQQRQIPLQAGTHSAKLLIPLNVTLASAKEAGCSAMQAVVPPAPANAAEIKVAMGHMLPFPNLL